jgi:hypothetical protein
MGRTCRTTKRTFRTTNRTPDRTRSDTKPDIDRTLTGHYRTLPDQPDNRTPTAQAAALPAVLLLMHAVLWHVHAGDGMSGLKWIARDRDGVAGREVRAARAKGGRAAACMAVDICSVCVVGQNVSGKF